ncbi:MAG TPA: hypothetical protein VHF01_02060 [Candidatus Acidoferrum sp.]|nr:hypothetical protein [Candidatus Acidoferrum sp.]
MSAARKILLLGGIALTVWGMSYGLWYAVFAEHQALEEIGSSLAAGFGGAAARNSAFAERALQQYQQAKYVYDRQVDVHSHWLGLAMLLIVLGIGLDRLTFSERIKAILSMSALVGSVLFPLGVLLQTVAHGNGPRALAVLGSALVIGALAAFAVGFARKPAA